MVFPGFSGGECRHDFISPCIITFEAFGKLKFQISQVGFNEPLVKFALFDVFNLFLDEFHHIFHALVLFCLGRKSECGIIFQFKIKGIRIQHFLLLIEIDIQNACFPIGKQKSDELDHVGIGRINASETVSKEYTFGIGTINIFYFWLRESIFGFE